MRIFYDTNVLISGFVGRGSCAEVIENSYAGNVLIYTEFILGEFYDVLRRKYKFEDRDIQYFISVINKRFIKGKNASDIPRACKDKNDDRLLADAVENKVDLLITGDKDLLDMKKYKEVRIISPKEYWKVAGNTDNKVEEPAGKYKLKKRRKKKK